MKKKWKANENHTNDRGAAGRTRTFDPRVNSPLLYRTELRRLNKQIEWHLYSEHLWRYLSLIDLNPASSQVTKSVVVKNRINPSNLIVNGITDEG